MDISNIKAKTEIKKDTLQVRLITIDIAGELTLNERSKMIKELNDKINADIYIHTDFEYIEIDFRGVTKNDVSLKYIVDELQKVKNVINWHIHLVADRVNRMNEIKMYIDDLNKYLFN